MVSGMFLGGFHRGFCKVFGRFLVCFWEALEGSTKNLPKTSQNLPKNAQKPPKHFTKTPNNLPKTFQKPTKHLPNISKKPPKPPQHSPKTSQKLAKNLPKTFSPQSSFSLAAGSQDFKQTTTKRRESGRLVQSSVKKERKRKRESPNKKLKVS